MPSYFLDSEENSYPKLSQARFSELLFQIILIMEEENLKFFYVTSDNIKIFQNDESSFRFKIEGSSLYRNTDHNIEEHVKLEPICKLIHSYYKDHSNPDIFNEDAIQEFENLYKVAFSKKTFYNFKFFSNTIKTIHSKFNSNNLIDLGQEPEDQQRFELLKCCQCFKVNLTPMFCLSECKCCIHKNCFEKLVGDYFQIKIRNEENPERLLQNCNHRGLHFDYKSMKKVHDMNDRRFEVSKQVKNSIKYLFLYPNEESPECKCEGLTKCKKVIQDSKGRWLPSRSCNSSCSFCGKNHKPETCGEFLKIFN